MSVPIHTVSRAVREGVEERRHETTMGHTCTATADQSEDRQGISASDCVDFNRVHQCDDRGQTMSASCWRPPTIGWQELTLRVGPGSSEEALLHSPGR